MTPTEKITAWLLVAAAALLGGVPLLLFVVFLYAGSLELVPLGLSSGAAIALDVLLCLAFFVQHSGMVRKPFRERLHPALPAHFHAACYAIASGLALLLVVAFWQKSDVVLYSAQEPVRTLLRAIFLAGIAGLVWAIHALKHFDALGLRAILRHLRGTEARALPLAVRGPYRWVRHPLYFLMLVLIWASPDLSLDRAIFALLWSGWIVIGTRLEERDLAAEFGADYRAYQEAVPMLIPWRRPRWPDRNGPA
jgi:methanethiol S-methyltransferase